ncbi:probable LRR receptor-like serine/threonine-protein kinase At1g67720 [Punica granatum]|uniref:non-specific serine/threonine protein kinase n=1 Tax=Punica granatum TaxID=22663 RepID=A0A6P8DXX9_PUNGR|nr:probable LRR receptor-like serine/threonine-protein kinase At1g67720 [Punica granatum]
MAGGVRGLLLLLIFSAALLMDGASAQTPGFVSLDCGGKESYVDDLGIKWTPDDQFPYGDTTQISVTGERRPQYATLRYFPADRRKYCYRLDVAPWMRYLLRATFLYGNFDGNNVYPKFDISLGATYWSTVVISGVDTVETREMIFLATEPRVSVCLYNATAGSPFISTLEVRQLIESMYSNDLEDQFYLSVSARINFGADGEAAVRYPDDPFDRIWESDSSGKPNHFIDMADGIIEVSTERPIDASLEEYPPQKVMQTAVVGTNGLLTYRLNLNGFPGFGWVISYFAEIEDLGSTETRKFRMAIPFPSLPGGDRPLVSIEENAGGKYRLYETWFMNVSLPFVFSFEFSESPNSSRGPLLNAMEIGKLVEITEGSPDVTPAAEIISSHPSADWAEEGGDPCLPVPWSWLHCNLESAPRITSIFLSKRNLTGNIPPGLTKLTHLAELWLDGNSFTGPIPDFTGCVDLKIIHLENNKLMGKVPSSLAKLRNLRELYLQNNMLSGTVPSALLRENLVLNVSGNINLHERAGSLGTSIIASLIVGAAVTVIAIVACAYFTYSHFVGMGILQNELPHAHRDEQAAIPHRVGGDKPVSSPRYSALEAARRFRLAEIEKATSMFGREIGSGGFGKVYYGQMDDGTEIAVKVLSRNSPQGFQDFLNEVAILSRIHHANLLELLGFCQEDGKSMLVCEYMHNGNLEDCLHGRLASTRNLTWMERLVIAEDAAKGVVYLHTGCSPAIMHKDLKSSNILLDENFRAKVADFGLSRFVAEGAPTSSSSHVHNKLRGTIGYVDPELTQYVRPYMEKHDVYSFGVILLELISGRKAVTELSDNSRQHISHWARYLLEKGKIKRILDLGLQGQNIEESATKMASTALLCVDKDTEKRPSMTEVLRQIEGAIVIERRRGRSSSRGAGPTHLRARNLGHTSDSGGES